MKFNVVFVGSVGGGKTSIIKKHFNNDSVEKHVTTIAIDFIPTKINDIEMAIWDTCGQERFMSITSSYFMRGHIFVLVHDIMDSEVSNDLNKWFLEIEKARRARHTPVVIVVSNKCDLNAFCDDSVSEWVREHSFDHIYTSAKTGEGIDSLFNKIHDSILVHQSDWLTPSLPALPVHPPVSAPGCMC
jgi:small GTP-binding protein